MSLEALRCPEDLTRAFKPDPIFAALAQHEKIDEALADAADALETAERQLDLAGQLNPCVLSIGNSHYDKDGFFDVT
ncbi:hypothetical protein [Bradyrhizobium iriomotense]|uniref:hypothetical protein n=1 Tax=Bradyrhizobium iriomotense TaxID=441950 RepID=UPI0024E0AC14|nr:hypothetical protein [Bradyrhizobium iriomotense]